MTARGNDPGEPVRVVLEVGKTWVFASALDWPGWSRREKGEHAALEELLAYSERYATVAGESFRPGKLHVVETLPGTSTTDFGAPETAATGEADPLDDAEAGRLADLLIRSWDCLDAVIAVSSAELRKGPRGGGRDRDTIAAHVQEAERSYARKVGVRIPPRTPWHEQRTAIAEAVRAGKGGSWSPRYFVRRTAWHVLDHAWEIEDKQT